MSILLYITSNPKPETESISLQLGKAFIEYYQQLKPQDTIIHLDLYKMDIPFLDHDVFTAWKKLSNGMKLEPIEELKINQINKLSDQFIVADKYIFVTPLWNLGIPPKLKMYIDCVIVKGKTFNDADDRTIGLLRGKKAVHIHARASDYSNNQISHPTEHSDSYLRDLLKMIGVHNYSSVIAEGITYADNETAMKIYASALDKIKHACEEFAKD